MTAGVLTTCHTQYTWDRSTCIFLFNRIPQVFVTYLRGALYVHPLWFYKHQQDNRVRSKLFVACQRWWSCLVPSVPGYLREKEEHKPDPWRNPIERNPMGVASVERGGQASSIWSSSVPRPIHRCGKCWFKNSLTCRWKWGGAPYILIWNHHSYLKCIVYDKLLKPRQSFRITLYIKAMQARYSYKCNRP